VNARLFKPRPEQAKKENNMGLQNEKIAALSYVTADLNYLTPPLDRPRTYTFEPPSGEPKSNIIPDPHSLPIYDVRPISERSRSIAKALRWSGKRVRSRISTMTRRSRPSITRRPCG
jgi:hypothetical protein